MKNYNYLNNGGINFSLFPRPARVFGNRIFVENVKSCPTYKIYNCILVKESDTPLSWENETDMLTRYDQEELIIGHIKKAGAWFLVAALFLKIRIIKWGDLHLI